MDSNKHNIILENRRKLTLDGIIDVKEFDDLSVALDTALGRLNIVGSELHIHTLCLEKGEVVIEGLISEIIYEDEAAHTKKGLFGRMTR